MKRGEEGEREESQREAMVKEEKEEEEGNDKGKEWAIRKAKEQGRV